MANISDLEAHKKALKDIGLELGADGALRERWRGSYTNRPKPEILRKLGYVYIKENKQFITVAQEQVQQTPAVPAPAQQSVQPAPEPEVLPEQTEPQTQTQSTPKKSLLGRAVNVFKNNKLKTFAAAGTLLFGVSQYDNIKNSFDNGSEINTDIYKTKSVLDITDEQNEAKWKLFKRNNKTYIPAKEFLETDTVGSAATDTLSMNYEPSAADTLSAAEDTSAVTDGAFLSPEEWARLNKKEVIEYIPESRPADVIPDRRRLRLNQNVINNVPEQYRQSVADILNGLNNTGRGNTSGRRIINNYSPVRTNTVVGPRANSAYSNARRVRTGKSITRNYDIPEQYRQLLLEVSKATNINPYLIAAMIKQESNWTPTAVSHAGARGLMQLVPATAKTMARRLGIPEDQLWNPDSQYYIFNPRTNMRLGAEYMVYLSRLRYKGVNFIGDNEVNILAAYNMGEGGFLKKVYLKGWTYWDAKHAAENRLIPRKDALSFENCDYVPRIQKHKEEYQKRYQTQKSQDRRVT